MITNSITIIAAGFVKIYAEAGDDWLLHNISGSDLELKDNLDDTGFPLYSWESIGSDDFRPKRDRFYIVNTDDSNTADIRLVRA